MIASIYGTLQRLGFNHPLHPIFVHIPIGMVVGMFFFSLVGLMQKDSHLPRTAYHCSVLALISIVPVILTGIMDWQYRLSGSLLPQIKIKMTLASILVVLLIYAVIARNMGASKKHLFYVYALCLLCVTGLGYEGGRLVYG